MSDVTRETNIEGEAPVNPYSLLEAVNASSQAAHTAWLIFLGAICYVLVAVAGITHRDLLVGAEIPLPLLNVRLELARFSLIVPSVVLVVHFALLAQLVVLTRKSLELDAALRMVEATDQRTHPLRLELNNFFPVQAIAGPERSWVVSVLLHGLAWLSLVALPIFALLFTQATFLPFHHTGITWAHRLLVATDIVLLSLTAVFLVRSEQSLRLAIGRTFRASPVRSAIAVVAAGFSAILAFLVLTIPGEPLDSVSGKLGGGASQSGVLHSGSDQRVLFGLLDRNLNVSDVDLTSARQKASGRSKLNLRERDLRFARLDRSALTDADLTGANLDGASLVGADLRGVSMGCVGDRADVPRGREIVTCTRGRGADFAKALLAGAILDGVDLSGARFAGANLSDAMLLHADLSGVNLAGAHLDKADLQGVNLQRANLTAASLEGANLANASLAGAVLTKAVMRGAVLNGAGLEGATLRNADLEAASLFQARLIGADLTGARMRAASLRESRVWLARIPNGAESALADITALDGKAPSQAELDALRRVLTRLPGPSQGKALAWLDKVGDASSTADAESGSSWLTFIRASEEASAQAATVVGSLVPTGSRITGAEAIVPYAQSGGLSAQVRLSDRKARLTRHLVELACQARSADGAVATGIARRAISPSFDGDAAALLDSLRRPECAGGRAIPPAVLEQLANAVDFPNPR
ncbi:MAG: pentapeptide repeat-containing protein [Hyphomicrobiaceae bacterium]